LIEFLVIWEVLVWDNEAIMLFGMLDTNGTQMTGYGESCDALEGHFESWFPIQQEEICFFCHTLRYPSMTVFCITSIRCLGYCIEKDSQT
jgi:hypothetical protein